jgi:hypothetical protein
MQIMKSFRNKLLDINYISGKIPGPVLSSSYNFIKLSFKEGLDSNFVNILNETIQSKRWLTVSPTSSQVHF